MTTTHHNQKMITPPELAKRWGVASHKILSWIDSGELRALNVASLRTGRPRWRIDEQEIARFELARASATAKQPRVRRKAPAGVKEFF